MFKTTTLLLLGVLGIIVLVRYAQFINDVRVGKALAKQITPFNYSLPNPRARLLIIGDSTALGTGLIDSSDSIAGKFHRDFPSVEIINISKNGARLSEVATMLPRAEGSFDLIIIQGGGNDVIYFTPLTSSAAQLDALFKESKQRATEVVSITSGNIGLAPIFPWPLNWIYDYRSKKFLGRFKTIAKTNNVFFVDLYQKRADDLLSVDSQKFYAKDKLHLSSDGYEFWYQKILKTLGGKNPLLK